MRYRRNISAGCIFVGYYRGRRETVQEFCASTISVKTLSGRLCVLPGKVIADNYIKRLRRLPQLTSAYIRPRLIICAHIKKFRAYRACGASKARASFNKRKMICILKRKRIFDSLVDGDEDEEEVQGDEDDEGDENEPREPHSNAASRSFSIQAGRCTCLANGSLTVNGSIKVKQRWPLNRSRSEPPVFSR